jgi:hypothetical protein
MSEAEHRVAEHSYEAEEIPGKTIARYPGKRLRIGLRDRFGMR